MSSPTRRLDRKGGDALDEFFARLTIGDEIGDRDPLQLVLFGEVVDLRSGHDGAVVIGEFADHADRRQAREPAEIDRRLGMAGAHQHAAVARDERKHMAGPDEIGRAHIAVGERAHRVAALLGGNAGGQPVPDIDRDGEGGAERRVVGRHHRLRCRRAASSAVSGAQTMPQQLRMMKAIFSGVQSAAAQIEIALVLAVVVVGDDDDLAARDRLRWLRVTEWGKGVSGRLAGVACAPDHLAADQWQFNRRSGPQDARSPLRAPCSIRGGQKGCASRLWRRRWMRFSPALMFATSFARGYFAASAAELTACRDMENAGASYSSARSTRAAPTFVSSARRARAGSRAAFSQLRTMLRRQGRDAAFAMNAGMYRRGPFAGRPLYRKRAGPCIAANTRGGQGNFHMKPNGVFWVENARAGVTETGSFAQDGAAFLRDAIGSDARLSAGASNPHIHADGTSEKIRNGVGVEDGHIVRFAISNGP